MLKKNFNIAKSIMFSRDDPQKGAHMHYSKGYQEKHIAKPEEEARKKHHSKSGAPDLTAPDTVAEGPAVTGKGNEPVGPGKEGKGNTPVGPGKH